MQIQTFGYNGVFQVSELLVNKLLASQVYDPSLVGVAADTPAEFIGPLSVDLRAGNQEHMYLLLGRPYVTFKSHDLTNVLSYSVPCVSVGMFVVDTSGNVTQQDSTKLKGIGLTVNGISVNKVASGLTVDLSKVTSADIEVDLFATTIGPTGIGGAGSVLESLPDNVLNQELVAAGVNVTAAQIRQEIADQLAGGLIATPSIPISIGGSSSPISQFDLALFDGSGDGYIDLLLFEQQDQLAKPQGQGEADQSGDILSPPAPPEPPFSVGVSLRADVVKSLIDATLDRGTQFFRQGLDGQINTTDDPWGYMVVPAAATRQFTLPTGTNASVTPPVGGKATITIPAGGLSGHARAHVDLLGTGVSLALVAAADGSASGAIAAASGDRLALSVDAASQTGDVSKVFWRPTFDLIDGAITVHTHYYIYIPKFCDAEGDADVTIALSSDPNDTFKIAATVINSSYQLPWWFYVADFFAPAVVPLFTVGLSMAAPFIAEVIARGFADPLVEKQIGNQLDTLKNTLGGAVPSGLAFFLAQVDVSTEGLLLSGYGDAGLFLRSPPNTISDFTTPYGREVWPVVTGGGPAPLNGVSFNWNPATEILSCNDAAVDADPETFWTSFYDDRPLDSSFVLGSTEHRTPLAAGQRAMVWVKLDDGHAKYLFERGPDGTTPAPFITMTFVTYQGRAYRGITVVPHVVQSKVSSSETGFLAETSYRYLGTVDLEPVFIFLTQDTYKAGLETWVWDGTVVTSQGISQNGITVNLNPDDPHHLDVAIDQTDLQSTDFSGYTAQHVIEFKGTDVFGVSFDAFVTIQTPRLSLSFHPLQSAQYRFPPQGDPELMRTEIERVASDLASRLPTLAGTQAARDRVAFLLAEALTTSDARIDQGFAQTIVEALGAGGSASR